MWGTFLKSNKPYSIKRQLTLSVGLLVSTLLIVSLYFSFQSAKHEVEEVYDARLGQSAKLMLLTLSISSEQNRLSQHKKQFESWIHNIQKLSNGSDDKATEFGHPYEQNIIFQFYRNNVLLWSSDPEQPSLSSSADRSGYLDINRDGVQWRTFQLAFPNTNYENEYIVVAEKQQIRQEIINEIALSTLVEQIILLPTLLLLLFWLINRYFRPINALRTAISQRNVHHLERIHVTDNTTELAPLVDALNSLLSELESAWQREKRFTRAAAHELKTPLTILRLNAENALQSHEPEQLKRDLENILQGIDRTDRLIQQLLTLAKVESMSEQTVQNIKLEALLQTVIADLAPLALRNGQEISLQPFQAQLLGDRILLEVLFRNLIDNAIRYSGSDSEIEVSAINEGKVLKVFVSDTGPEIPKETRERIFEQFYRGHTEKGDGAGLGMSICKDIATLHGATIEIAPHQNGVNKFVITFPLT